MTAPDQCCINVKKALVNQAPSTHDPKRTMSGRFCCDARALACYTSAAILGLGGSPMGRDCITLLCGAAAEWPLAANAERAEKLVVKRES
jgi:hypothetical protein